jgi:hypothetical protein
MSMFSSDKPDRRTLRSESFSLGPDPIPYGDRVLVKEKTVICSFMQVLSS